MHKLKLEIYYLADINLKYFNHANLTIYFKNIYIKVNTYYHNMLYNLPYCRIEILKIYYFTYIYIIFSKLLI